MKNIRKIAAVLMTLLLCVPFFNVTSAKQREQQEFQ